MAYSIDMQCKSHQKAYSVCLNFIILLLFGKLSLLVLLHKMCTKKVIMKNGPKFAKPPSN